MTSSEKIEKAKAKLQAFIKKAYLPIVKVATPKHDATTKFGGLPYLRNNKDWETCPSCKQNMQLFVQLNLETLPLKYSNSKGLIQLFYCTNEAKCELSQDNFLPFSQGVVARKIQVKGNSATQKPNLAKVFEEKQVTTWETIDDYPSPEEYVDLGIEIDRNTVELLEDADICLPAPGDKLGGWPYWLQYREYIEDEADDESEFSHLLQLDSQDNLPFDFGEGGLAYLMYNPKKDEELALLWQSL